jgi:hypothetical protein
MTGRDDPAYPSTRPLDLFASFLLLGKQRFTQLSNYLGTRQSYHIYRCWRSQNVVVNAKTCPSGVTGQIRPISEAPGPARSRQLRVPQPITKHRV